MIDGPTLRELLDYDPETGIFIWKSRAPERFTRLGQWKNWNGRYPGTVAGTISPKGYRMIGVLERFYPAHRLAWFYVTGAWPDHQIDHINGRRDDNRFANLRDVTSSDNARNKNLRGYSATGRIGVTSYNFHGRPRYVARIRADGVLRHLGYFDTVDEAAKAREAAEARFGFRGFSVAPEDPQSKTPLRSRNTFQRRGS